MNYVEVQPPAALRPYVASFWILTSSAGETCASERPVFPDGTTEAVFHFGDPFREVTRHGNVVEQPRGLFVGQMVQPTVLMPGVRTAAAGVRFRPSGASAFIQTPQYRLINQILPLDALWPKLHRALERDHDTIFSGGSFPHVEKVLIGGITRNFDFSIQNAALAIEAGFQGGVEELARSSGCSSRHLRRRFLAGLGLGPKTFGRLLRFQRALESMTAGASLAAVSAAGGYSDQSHLIRDFKDFAGATPVQVASRLAGISEIFLRIPEQ